MKKALALLAAVLICGTVFAERTYFDFEDFFTAKRILNVSKRILDVPLKDFSVAYLSNKECRLLRNSIYFYHGHKFQSDELKEYFYNNFSIDREDPKKTSTTVLSKTDDANVKLIQLYEKREEKTEAELKKTKIPAEYVGSWYLESFIIGNDECACLRINKDNTFSLIPNHNGGGSHFRAYDGKIYISNNTMYLYIKSILLSDEGYMGYFDPLYDYSAKKTNYTMALNQPIILSFPITAPERSETTMLGEWDEVNMNHDKGFTVDKYIHMNLGSMVFFKEENQR